ncbi:hypothetical protein JHK82_027186 [Glycine max]|nr:hypothetical protein JHK85_027811 [Glycine max]KAG5126351.1 hypothetical protein JHK82_027186 [Glycine max]
MIQSLALHLAARFRHYHNLVRLSSSSSSASTLHHATPSPFSSEPVHITQNCVRYVFNLDDRINSDDKVFEKGVKLVVDNISYDFVKGATVDYVEELIRSAFVDFIIVVTTREESFFVHVWELMAFEE